MTIGTSDVAIALTALYLPGGPRPFEPVRRLWPRVEHALRAGPGNPDGLTQAGLTQEAMLLTIPALMEWAATQVETGASLTTADERYPKRWLNVLGHGAPPALWKAGEVPTGPFLSVVGSRRVTRGDLAFAQEIGAEAVRQGFAVASGAAAGCDSASVRGADEHCVEILPRGLFRNDHRQGKCRLSARPCGEVFSAGAAMERNTLIYAISNHTVVVHARHNEGGTWAGARTALRRKLCSLIVRVRPNDAASRILIALGGVPIDSPSALAEALRMPPAQMQLGSSW